MSYDFVLKRPHRKEFNYEILGFNVIDGDTIAVHVDEGLDGRRNHTIRLEGKNKLYINFPETKSKHTDPNLKKLEEYAGYKGTLVTSTICECYFYARTDFWCYSKETTFGRRPGDIQFYAIPSDVTNPEGNYLSKILTDILPSVKSKTKKRKVWTEGELNEFMAQADAFLEQPFHHLENLKIWVGRVMDEKLESNASDKEQTEDDQE